jgi:hypothetical protein
MLLWGIGFWKCQAPNSAFRMIAPTFKDAHDTSTPWDKTLALTMQAYLGRQGARRRV